MSLPRCIIAGIALATPQGCTAAGTWDRLIDGAILRGVGRVPIEAIPAFSRASQLAIHVARAALADAGWSPQVMGEGRTALLIGTSKGPIEAWLNPLMATWESPGEMPAFGLASIAADVGRALRHGCGPRLTLSAACASGLHALIRAQQLLAGGQCDRALVIATESAIGPIFEASFRRLGVLARPEIGCRPFDARREGFLLAESAAALCMERSDAPGIAIVATAMLADAHHLTAPDPAGRGWAAALRAVAGDGSIDLVHAHGTGTLLNDPAELAAIERSIGSTKVVSHKHAIGHTQGAAGLIGIVLNVMAHRRGEIFGNANTAQPLRAAVQVSAFGQKFKVRSSVALAAGFGGPVAAVRLNSID